MEEQITKEPELRPELKKEERLNRCRIYKYKVTFRTKRFARREVRFVEVWSTTEITMVRAATKKSLRRRILDHLKRRIVDQELLPRGWKRMAEFVDTPKLGAQEQVIRYKNNYWVKNKRRMYTYIWPSPAIPVRRKGLDAPNASRQKQ